MGGSSEERSGAGQAAMALVQRREGERGKEGEREKKKEKKERKKKERD